MATKKVIDLVESKVATVAPQCRHGLGEPAVEDKACAEVSLFVRVCGGQYMHYRRLVPKETRLRDIKPSLEKEIGRTLAQDSVVDENGYTFTDSALDQPVWKFSNKCRLHVCLQHPCGIVGHAVGQHTRMGKYLHTRWRSDARHTTPQNLPENLAPDSRPQENNGEHP